MDIYEAAKRASQIGMELGVTGREPVTVREWYAGPSMAEQRCGVDSRYPGASAATPVLLSHARCSGSPDIGAVAAALWDGAPEPTTRQEWAELAAEYGETERC